MTPPTPERQPGDAGLQPERTSLAWQRTGLALLLIGSAAGRVGWQVLGPWALVPSGALVAGAVAVLVSSRHRYLGRVGLGTVGRPLDGRLPLLVAVLALGAAAFGGFLVALPPLGR